ncbi:MAG: glutaredoxin family protein [Methylophilales bacterium]|nr:glutaredoxin family protein [Methylophilales bacterium]
MFPQLILYGTLGCHLCEQAEAIVIPVAQNHQLHLSFVDIAEQSGFDAYETRIPLLRLGLRELDWPFDTITVTKFIITK